ncbi:MAG TPA: monovalent cation:proton antiporter-2 (CPA2) family protein [Chitinophagaceae bacterium]|nr:monovalent cation:proton antiporter-2 (CPA2) family protein [Chitinophagaceae bacterium]
MDQHNFLFQAMVYLAAAVVMVPLAKKLGFGSVLGYLVAGILIGPFVLGFIGQEGQDLMHFAEFGVVMMLFIIGLELEPELLWKLRKSIAGLGGLQVLMTGTVVAGIAMIAGLDWRPALALGMILSLSSTAIVLQTLNEKALMKTSAGQSSFSVLLFQDIAVIPMLALFPLLAIYQPAVAVNEEQHTLVSDLPGWGQTLVVLGSVAGIIVMGRFLIRPFLRIVAGTRSREVFTATALLLIVGIAVLMTQVGLSPALGAFLAGVVLANSEYRHELESDIEPFKGLLLGLFFIAVGASINFSLITERPLLIFGLVLAIMSVKSLVLFVLGKIFRLSLNQNMLFAVALSQVGEFAFVLLSFSLQEGILPQGLIDIMMAVVAISMAVTPLSMMLHERVIQPWLGTKESVPEKEADTIDEKNPVIIAGFGHFGNTIGRFLRAHGIKTTILDLDSERVETLRRMGFKVYYGDASRYDLLHAAGADQARLIIIALEPEEKRLEMIDTIKKHFPNLRMLVRASNRFDAYNQMNAGMLHIYRETIDTALRLGVDAMKMLGYRAYTAQRSARLFFKHDEANLKKLSSIKDKEEYILTARAYIEEIEKMLQADIGSLSLRRDAGWDEDSLIAESRGNGWPEKKAVGT